MNLKKTRHNFDENNYIGIAPGVVANAKDFK
jgi:hypothetical protein